MQIVNKLNEKDFIKIAKTGFKNALSRIPFINIQKIRTNVKFGNKEIDLLVNVLIGSNLQNLSSKWSRKANREP